MPYTFTHSTSPADPTKVLTEKMFVANCTANQTWQSIDLTFGNV